MRSRVVMQDDPREPLRIDVLKATFLHPYELKGIDLHPRPADCQTRAVVRATPAQPSSVTSAGLSRPTGIGFRSGHGKLKYERQSGCLFDAALP